MTHTHAGGAAPIEQHWKEYIEEQHERWRRLYRRQMKILPHRACPEFLAGLHKLDISKGIPRFEDVNEVLAQTKWEVVGVAGLVSDADFFQYLSQRKFPSTCFLREESQFDYIVEPDIFHDGFGHLPMLMNPIVADFMQEYGKGGLRVLNDPMRLKQLARLYWYTIEFGLTQTPDGLRIYGSGIVSSPQESVYALESTDPLRLAFDLMRVMRTQYEIDHLQDMYFVIESIGQLIEVTMQDFDSLYKMLARNKTISPGCWWPGDRKVPSNISIDT